MNPWRALLNVFRWKPEARIYTSQRQAGVAVTEDTAQTFSAVAACVRIISETLASLPWCVYRKLAGGREELPSNPIAWLLGYQPNPEQTAMVFRRQALAHYLLWGNGDAEIERGADGRAIWLWPLLPDRSEIRRSETGALVCVVRDAEGKQYILPRENVFHLSDGSFDGLMGLSRVQLARRSIGAGIAQDVFTASYYQNGAAVGGVIEQKSGATLSASGIKELLKSFNEDHQGPDRARKTLYLDAGMEYKSVTLPLSDAQFLETRRFQVEDICRWFGVPQHLVQMLTESNYAISYTADKNFVEHTLRPIAVLMEQEANLRLFGARARGTIYSRLNLSALMRGDPKVRGEWYKAMVNAGVMSINEVRALEELNSIGPEGDEHYLQTSMTTLGRIAAGTNITQPAAPAAPASDPNADAYAARTERLIRAHGETLIDLARAQKPTPVVVNPANVHVEQPRIEVKAGDVHVQPPAVTINQGRVRVENHLPAPKVDVAAPSVSVTNEVTAPVVRVAAPRVTVENQVNPTPLEVNVAAPDVKVENRVDVPAPQVTVEAAQITVEAPSVQVAAPEVRIDNRVEVPPVEETESTYTRDKAGEVSKIRTRRIRSAS